MNPVKGKVLNKHRDGIPEGAVYIGRGSPWGNPYIIGKHGDHQQVVKEYALMLNRAIELQGSPLIEKLASLHGKDLVCFCAPKACHGDVLLRAAEWAYGELYARDETVSGQFEESA